jgi:hypothetical protein
MLSFLFFFATFSFAEKTDTTSSSVESVLFVFDLDETLTNRAYKKEAAMQGRVHLKPGLSKMFTSIITFNHRIAIATANVSRDVESFLMDELGLDYTDESHYSCFRDFIRIKQPDLPSYMRNAEPFKVSKGKMVSEVLRDLSEEGYRVDGVIFSDDKSRFHHQVLREKLSIPHFTLHVGDRKRGVHPGTSMEFARLITNLTVNKTQLAFLLGQFHGTMMKARDLEITNESLNFEKWDHGDLTEESLAANKTFGAWFLSNMNENCLCNIGKGDAKTCSLSKRYKATRKFNKKPVPPRYHLPSI